jgi:glycosyltransferase involved in cell wall biosynthesis
MTQPLVAISVVTYQRPHSLRRLMTSLNKLKFEQVACPRIRFCVVDNDADRSAKAALDAHQFPADWQVHYEVVSQRGLSHVRNRAIELSCDADFLVFIDDDQVADACWLDRLLATQQKCNAGVVWGRNLPLFDQPPEEHVHRLGYFKKNGIGGGDGDIRRNVKMKMGYFDPPAVPTGGSCNYADTNNVLVKRAILTDDLRFNPIFNGCGGEDREFFGRVASSENKIVWANEAKTYECLPPERTRLRWMMRREYASGICYVKEQFAAGKVWSTRIERGLKSFAHLAFGAGLIIVGCLAGRKYRGRGCLWIARGAGTMAGLFGGDCAVYR